MFYIPPQSREEQYITLRGRLDQNRKDQASWKAARLCIKHAHEGFVVLELTPHCAAGEIKRNIQASPGVVFLLEAQSHLKSQYDLYLVHSSSRVFMENLKNMQHTCDTRVKVSQWLFGASYRRKNLKQKGVILQKLHLFPTDLHNLEKERAVI